MNFTQQTLNYHPNSMNTNDKIFFRELSYLKLFFLFQLYFFLSHVKQLLLYISVHNVDIFLSHCASLYIVTFWRYNVDHIMRSRHLICFVCYRRYDHTSIMGK